jgi:serine/threonine protein kinase
MNPLETKYDILEIIGSGKFGEIYKATNKRTSEIVAIKKEKKECLAKLLKHETIMLNYLYRNGCPHIPLVYWYGNIDGDYYLVMPFYTKMSVPEQMRQFMIQMITILQHIHRHHVIHRDIKPANIMILNNEYYLIDFGLSTFYIDDDLNHVKNSLKEYILGTPNYISIHVHDGEEPSRRDDLISLGYVYLYYLFNRFIYWEDAFLTKDELFGDPTYIVSHRNQVKKEKKKDILGYLQQEEEYKNIHDYLEYCYTMEYDKKPNYDGLIQLFMNE